MVAELFSVLELKSETRLPNFVKQALTLCSKQGFELVFLAKNPNGEGWALDRENSVGLPGAHGEEIVRSFCFFDEAHVVYTAGEDGNVKAWRPN